MAGVRLCAGRKVRLYHTLYQTNSTTPSLLDQLEKTNFKSDNPTLNLISECKRQLEAAKPNSASTVEKTVACCDEATAD